MNRNKHIALIRNLKWLDKFAYLVMADPSIRISQRDYHKVLFYLQMVKMHTAFGGVMELIKKGYGVDAMIIVRSMLNNLVNCKWIMGSRQKTKAKRFIKYNLVLRKKFLDIAKKYPEHKGHFKKILDEEQKIVFSYKKVEKLFAKDKNKWAGISIKQMAKDANYEWDYDFVYNLASSLEHSDINSLNEFIEGVDDTSKLFKFKGGPSTSYIMQSGIAAIKYMGEGTELFIKVFKLNNSYKKRLLRFAERVSRTLKEN